MSNKATFSKRDRVVALAEEARAEVSVLTAPRLARAMLPTFREIEIAIRKRRQVLVRKRWVYVFPAADGVAEIVVDPECVPERFQLRTEDMDELRLTFRDALSDDYIPRAVLDGPTGRGRLRANFGERLPVMERKVWQRRYSLAYVLNGRDHFDVNDAWVDRWPCDHVYDLRRAHDRLLSRLESGTKPDGDGDGLEDPPGR